MFARELLAENGPQASRAAHCYRRWFAYRRRESAEQVPRRPCDMPRTGDESRRLLPPLQQRSTGDDQQPVGFFVRPDEGRGGSEPDQGNYVRGHRLGGSDRFRGVDRVPASEMANEIPIRVWCGSPDVNPSPLGRDPVPFATLASGSARTNADKTGVVVLPTEACSGAMMGTWLVDTAPMWMLWSWGPASPGYTPRTVFGSRIIRCA